MTNSKQSPGKVSLRQRLRGRARRVSERMAPRDATTGREPMTWRRKAGVAALCVVALVAWGTVLIWVVN